ncbi:TetR/AcrR family transcriptional regulator [Auraticoccus monumenti]|uniref:DNA-binding transcriptional regulator, AcrR family n=1 Tax=Auraticoccus monumenti TaxID=675864 RepID=A0A1G6YPN6_9ACTN|nr:TetR/AcrR family transcriptional regulator [Auraticoccus monumenti]SDD92359.1 DNA-binding transcriptional regulator, AcrR family [Auraticoccus monumenti]
MSAPDPSPAARGADSATRRPGGRTARTRAVVLDAALEELATSDDGDLTLDRIATRAGVPRSTIYRRWGGLDGVLLEAIATFATDQARVPDTGRVEDDLRLWARSVHHTLTDPVSGRAVAALLGRASTRTAALRHRFWSVRSALVRPVVQRAVERGQLPDGTDADDVIRHVGAPLYYSLFVLGEPITPATADLAAAATAAAAHAGVFVRPAGALPA